MKRARAGARADSKRAQVRKATHRVRRDRVGVDASTGGLTVKPERFRQSESGRVPVFTTTTTPFTLLFAPFTGICRPLYLITTSSNRIIGKPTYPRGSFLYGDEVIINVHEYQGYCDAMNGT